ncbi:hypothetical protein Nos7107_0968 [Nostoc sp. PCC 7107]|nr:hypothetical protein Nos7107_0968 [Nostoc sp. PCC 7107]
MRVDLSIFAYLSDNQQDLGESKVNGQCFFFGLFSIPPNKKGVPPEAPPNNLTQTLLLSFRLEPLVLLPLMLDARR